MKSLETEIEIDASPQTVWSVLDDLERYPEWNALVPELSGLTVVGQVVTGAFVLPNMPAIPLAPTLIRIVGARELRWVTTMPGFTAEHYFILTPTADGGTHLTHNEDFEGSAVATMWPGVGGNGPAYMRMNEALKARAEALEAARPTLHPAVDDGVRPGAASAGATLRCHCAVDPVEIRLDAEVMHNHLCGCSKCWKPAGALFAQMAVVPTGARHVTANADKLNVVDASQSIRRHACRACRVHMFGCVEDADHHFYGLDFVHPELATEAVAPAPEFAGFVSSIIETGESPSNLAAVRKRLAALGVPAYDAFSSELMDIIAWHKIKMSRRV
jgi:S-(hydroxymethyl)glutathione synthase